MLALESWIRAISTVEGVWCNRSLVVMFPYLKFFLTACWWFSGCRLLMWEDAYYEEQIGMLVEKMLHQVHLVGEGYVLHITVHSFDILVLYVFYLLFGDYILGCMLPLRKPTSLDSCFLNPFCCFGSYLNLMMRCFLCLFLHFCYLFLIPVTVICLISYCFCVLGCLVVGLPDRNLVCQNSMFDFMILKKK